MNDLHAARVLAEALALGFLIGAERYRGRGEGEESPAGVRTFATIGLVGGTCSVLGETAFTVATFVVLAAFLLLGYYRRSRETLGTTTNVAALLTFWLAYLVRDHETVAIGAGIVMAILLASKRPLHDFVRGVMSDVEFYATLKFLAVVFVVYPILPDVPVGPLVSLSPRDLWSFVVLFSTISFAGYVLVRALGPRRGLTSGALAGGLASTTALTVALAQRARQSPDQARLYGSAAILGNVAQPLRLLALCWLIEPRLASSLALPLAAMSAVGVAGSWFLGGLRRSAQDQPPSALVGPANPYAFLPAFRFALLLGVILTLSRAALTLLGEDALTGVAALTGLASVSAIALPLAGMVREGTLSVGTAGTALLVALGTNAAVKWGLAAVNGERRMALWLGAGLIAMLGAGALALVLTGS